MRTREEQASVLMQVICDAGWKSSDAYDLAMREILEAERRAERRVRAEIGRPLEGALYTATRNTFARSIGPRTLEIFDQEYKSAIDSAREVG